MANPILALIPSGYKATEVYSVLPSDGSGDFTFDRANGLATRLNKDGLIEEVANDTPRLDYSNSTCPTLLLEDERTNLQAYSENFGGAAWTPAFSTITANSNISPNGELSAYNFETTSSAGFLNGLSTIVANTVYSYSLYVKANTTNICKVLIFDSNTGGQKNPYGWIQFDMSTEAITSSLGTASFDKLDNGWYRLKVTGTSPNPLGGGATGVEISLTEIGSIFIWGAQMEAGSLSSTYIKNVNSASGVTRFKDKCINGGDATLFDITEGSFFVDVLPYKSGLFYNISLSNGGSTNRISWQFQSNGTQVKLFSSGSVSNLQAITFNQRNKMLVTFKLNEYKIYINGALVHTETGTVPTGFDRVNFAVYAGTNNFFQGEVNDTRVYDKVLTPAEAIILTTI
mgnify:FL=1